jgi:hypothetical protein
MDGVHRRLAYLLAWSVAATVTVSIAWLGIRSVLAAAAPTRTVPLSAVQLRRVAPPPPDTLGSADPSSSANPSSPRQSPSATIPSPTDSWEQDGEGFQRTFHTVGGDVDFFTGKDAVQVASSLPKPGYTVNVTRYASDSVMVSFFGSRKTSRVWVRWWNGPYAEITESVN